MLGSAQRVKGADLASVICDLFFTGILLAPQHNAVDGWDSFQGKEDRFWHLELNVTAFVLAKDKVLLQLPFGLRWAEPITPPEMDPFSSAAVP